MELLVTVFCIIAGLSIAAFAVMATVTGSAVFIVGAVFVFAITLCGIVLPVIAS